jgi:hypothetical protein
MAKPQSKPALRKAPRRSHPVAPDQSQQAENPPPDHDPSPRSAPPRRAEAPSQQPQPPTEPADAPTDTVVFSARIPRALKREVKATAAQRDQPVQDLVVEALRSHLDRISEPRR